MRFHPPIELGQDWHFLRGYGHGLQQPSLRGEIHLAASDSIDFAALDAFMADVVIEPLPEVTHTYQGTEGILHRLLFWTLAITRQHKIPTSYGICCRELRRESTRHTVLAALPSIHPQSTVQVLRWVARTMVAILASRAADQPATDNCLAEFSELAKELGNIALTGQNTIYFYHAAFELGFPVQPLGGNVHCLGLGNKSRYFVSTITDLTSSIGVNIAKNKVNTARTLRPFGLPVPTHMAAPTLEAARQHAGTLGYPVVIKPADKEQGVGVFAGITRQEDLDTAYGEARKHSEKIIVEKHFDGVGHRLTVCLNKVIKVTKKLPGGVIGDGEHSVAQLVEIAAAKACIRQLYAPAKQPLALDEEAVSLLAQNGLTTDHVPKAGEYLALRRKNNATSGGLTLTLVVDEVHPDNLALAVRAAAILRLDLAGIDLLIPDITRSWTEVGALLCEVNAQPQTDLKTIKHIAVELMGGNPRIPVHLVVHRRGLNPESVDNIAANLASRLGCNLRSTDNGIWQGQTCISRTKMDSFQAAQAAIYSPDAEAALCVMSEEEVLTHGLPTDLLTSIRYVPGNDPTATSDHEQSGRKVPDELLALAAGHCASDVRFWADGLGDG